MNTGLRKLTVALLTSFFFAVAGLAMYHSGYNKTRCVLAALNQAETLKNFPHALANGEVSEMPLYHVNPDFSGPDRLKGVVIGSYYEGSFSRRLAEIRVSAGPFSKVTLYWVFDTRVRR